MTAAIPVHSDPDQFPRVATFLSRYAAGPGRAPTGTADLAGAVERAIVVEHPFVVATIDGFLPDDLYRAVLSGWDTITMRPVELAGAAYVGSRTGALLVDWTPHAQGPADGTAWAAVADTARAAALVHALFTRFAPTVEANLADPGVADAAEAGFVFWANQDHGPDEALGAHVDGLHKLLTVVLYLDLQGPTTVDSDRRWGTTLYDVAPGSVKPVEFSPNSGREPAGHVDFRPNRAFVMPNVSHALHGVAGGQEGVTRRSLMWGYWYRGPRR